ncbi:molybdopterin molybdochelatase [Nocardioides scoriae]|uniref:Molybdopterin molybdenumtransferase n=1 Tax=Nocardioides scoriae TaxID=642780 RepID=A0A1H1S214_9ACTN|nr:gephyrin-like molybdotransferase Glp [Nocardioides scoriae]SDS42022.1 molybdopterin molybdochelatase [Nocardioides scoriae]
MATDPPRPTDVAPLSMEDYRRRVLEQITPLTPSQRPLLDAIGLPLADDVVAEVALPGFDNSSMDGYAVAFADVAEATAERPVHLPVVGEIAAGQTTIHSLTPGTAVRIMTGAPVPAGATAVVPFEWTHEEGREVVVAQAPDEGQHVRRAGEEVQRGDVLMRRGQVIGTRHVGLLAALGNGSVTTAPRPRVVVMSTGSELVEPGKPLAGDQIYDANSFLLAAAVRAHGGIAYRARATTDDPREFADALSDQLLRADLVVTSGGVSKGTHDVVKEVLRELGTVDFLEVKMQPGKPQGFGVVGEDRTPIFTLPGNPVSAYVSFEVFVAPALRRLTGQAGTDPVLRPAVLTESVRSMRGKTQLLRVAAEHTGGQLRVTPVGGPGSHLIAGLAQADGLVVLAEDVAAVSQGDLVPVLLLDRPQEGR